MTIKAVIRKAVPRPLVRRIYRRRARRYIDSLPSAHGRDKKTILILNHYFDQDIRALQLASREYKIVVVDGPRLFKGGKIFFSDAVMKLQAPYDAAPEANRRQFHEDCRLIFDHLRERFSFSLIITASDNFWWVREFIAVGHEQKVKTVVLDKEGTRSPYAVRGETGRIRDMAPFISDHIFVWSRRQKEFWQKAGVDRQDISIIGQPRSDLFYVEHESEVDRLFPSARPLITLFSYEDTVYIPPAEVIDGGPTWHRMKRETHDAFGRLAEDNPQFNFVIKAHPQQSDLNDLKKRYRRDNLIVVGGSSAANELIQRSELIIAFQTTAIIEAMFLGRRVIYTAWDENYVRFMHDLLPFHKAPGIVVADSLDHFNAVCARFFSGDHSDFQFSAEEQAARDRFAAEYLYMPDGHVCERFFEAIDKFVA